MKLLLLLLFSLTCLAQKKAETTLYINPVAVDSEYKQHIKNYGVDINRLKGNREKESYYARPVKGTDNLLGVKIPEDGRFKIRVSIARYYPFDTIIETGKSDSISITVRLKPKKYVYTEAKAKEDIKNGIVRFITFDKNDLDTKIDVKKQFGFEYLLIDDKKVQEFEDEIIWYNLAMEEHLTTVDSTWYKRYSHVADSITHQIADSYTRQHTIDIGALKVPKYRKLPEKMKKAIAETKHRAKSYEIEIGSEKTSQVLDWIDNDKDYHHISEAKYWMAYHYQSMIPELIKRITNKKEVGLINTADLGIWERCNSGDLKVYDHGLRVDDDLFTVAGRANYLLGKITGEYFGWVSMYATEADLKKLQNRWAYWLLQLQEK